MSDQNPRTRLQNGAPIETETVPAPKAVPDLLLESEVFWEKYKLPILALLVVGLVGLLGSQLYSRNRYNSLMEGSAQLDAAKSIDDYKKIIAEHGDTPAADNAAVLLGRMQVEAKDYVGAAQTWQTFADKNAQHSLAPNALMGAAGALETAGKLDQARDLYKKIQAAYGKSYVAALASLAEAGLLKSQGKSTDAKRVYENVIASSPQSDAARQATENLRLLKAVPNLPADPAPTPAPAVSPVPPAVSIVPPLPLSAPAPAVVPAASAPPVSTPIAPVVVPPAATPKPTENMLPSLSPTPAPTAVETVAPSPSAPPVSDVALPATNPVAPEQ